MKLVEAVIRQLNLHEVRSALDEMGVEDFRESSVICHGHKQGQVMRFRGAEFVEKMVERVKLEIFAADDSVERIIDVISSITKGNGEDCRIGVRPYLEVS